MSHDDELSAGPRPITPTATLDRPAPAEARPGHDLPPGILALARPAALLAVALGVLLRLWTRSELWLDEALSLNIAALPVEDIGDALRQDGAPPLYYLLLHLWTGLVGDGPLAARWLSAAFSLAALPLAWSAGRRTAGREGGWLALLLLATSPFAIRYATEVRMYALVQLLALAGYVLVRRALARPTAARLAPVALVAGLLPLTHYWALFLLAAAAAALLVVARREDRRRAARRCLAALAAGGLLFLPWVPSFLFQVRRTGNPWDPPAELGSGLVTAFLHFGGSHKVPSIALALALGALTLFALVRGGARGGPGAPWTPGAIEAAVGLGALVTGLVASRTVGAAFSSRYASALFPLVVLAAAAGATALRSRRVRYGVVALVVVAGLVGGLQNAARSRTQAPEVAAAIAAGAGPRDVVGYCPDQLGPAVERLLPTWLQQLAYPHGSPPQRVNWVDYAERHGRANPVAFARLLDSLAGQDGTVWLVWREGYRTLGLSCERVAAALRGLRPSSTVEVTPAGGGFETHYLTRSPGS